MPREGSLISDGKITYCGSSCMAVIVPIAKKTPLKLSTTLYPLQREGQILHQTFILLAHDVT